jgi:hypothetical protein
MKNKKNVDENLDADGDSTTCRFCGYFDPNFDENTYFMHLYKECPMVINIIIM